MTSTLRQKLNQTITYWASAGPDSAGDDSFDTPVAISGRWDYEERLVLDSRGKERKTSSVIFVDQDVEGGDFLLLGTSVVADPTTLTNAFEIFVVNKMISVDGSEFVREVLA